MFTTTTTEPPGGSPRRPSSAGPVAATWVAGTGAFLLLAAAAVFIAVQWDRLPEAAKLAVVGGLTGAFLVGGRALRRTLPATGDVVFHLGALLLPVDLAGLGLRASVGWRSLLLAEGILGVGVLGALAAAAGSVVLAWVATASMVVLALGVAAVSPAPAAVVVGAAAVAATLAGGRRQAVVWSAVATLAPVLAFGAAAVVDGAGAPGAGVLAALGLDGTPWAFAGCVAGSVVLAREARSRGDVALAGLALGGFASGLVATWSAAGVGERTTLLALPVAFLAVEVAALLADRDPFWRRLGRGGAVLAEVVAAAVGGLWTLAIVLVAPIVETGFDLLSDVPGWEPERDAGTALAVLAVAWLVAGLRRREAAPVVASALRTAVGHPWTAGWSALAMVAAVEVATASAVATAAALVVVGAALASTAAPAAAAVAAGLAFWAPVASLGHPMAALGFGAAGAGVAVLAAMTSAGARSRRGRPLAFVALTTAAAGSALAVPVLGAGPALAVFVLQAWAAGVLLDRGDVVAGHVARAGVLGGGLVAVGLLPGEGLGAAVVATALLAVDAVRLDRPQVAVAAAATLQVVAVQLAGLARFDLPQTGLVLVLAAVVWSGLATMVEGHWQPPFVAAAGMGVGAGLGLASGDVRMLADALIATGGLVTVAGIVGRSDAVAHVGGAAATAGILLHLDAAAVVAVEPYVAPVALQLAVAGWRVRQQRPLTSWVAYAPAVALLGGAALAERLGGGASWHALVAGSVGAVAVAAGGWRRLAGPLLLGTALLVAVTLVECVGALAGVPTWAWLAAGGSALLAVGIGLERADASPVDAGRRLVDVIAERFD